MLNIVFVFSGKCVSRCTREYSPKCGTDRRTYGNQCTMDEKICKTSGQVTKAYDGACGKLC